MNNDYLEGFQSATVIVMEQGLEFASENVKQYGTDDNYTLGYKKGVQMMEERLKREEAIIRVFEAQETLEKKNKNAKR